MLAAAAPFLLDSMAMVRTAHTMRAALPLLLAGLPSRPFWTRRGDAAARSPPVYSLIHVVTCVRPLLVVVRRRRPCVRDTMIIHTHTDKERVHMQLPSKQTEIEIETN